MKQIRNWLLVVIFLTGITSPAFSQFELAELDEELDAEFQWLQAESVVMTEIATKTEMDADMAPGIVTILQGQDLKRRGMRTVLEALTLVPGLDFSLSYGDPMIVVRGIGSVLGSGKLKIMLNNSPVNNTLYGTANPVYDIPVEQISRIEIIRGPGSALYGKWAYAGVINVITRQDDNRIFGEYGRFDTWNAGGIATYANPEKDFKISLNMAHRQRDHTDVEAGRDWLHETPLAALSNSPGPVNDSRESLSAFLTLDYKDISLLAQWTSASYGNYFGIINLLPPMDDDCPNSHKTYMAEIGWEPEISQHLGMDIRMGWREYIFELDKVFQYPAGLPIFDDSGNVVGVFEDGISAGPYYKERTFYGSADIHWKKWEHHALLFGMEYEKTKMEDVWHELNYHVTQVYPLSSFERFQGDENWLYEDKDRGIFSLYAQEQFQASDRLSFTGGIRYDTYDDTDNKLSPRIAASFSATDHHIFKAQYSEAFRPPSFYEMYSINNPTIAGNADIEPETVRTYEMGYIYKDKRITSQITLFYARLKDLITVDNTKYVYKNSGNAETKGAELELRCRILPSLTADANISYADTEDDSTGEEIEGSARWLGNAGLLYQPLDDLFLSLQYHYVGERNRAVNDSREKLDDYHQVHLTASVENFMIKGLTLRGGIKNLFDEDVRYTSPLTSYIDDYPQPGREWWVQFSVSR